MQAHTVSPRPGEKDQLAVNSCDLKYIPFSWVGKEMNIMVISKGTLGSDILTFNTVSLSKWTFQEVWII